MKGEEGFEGKWCMYKTYVLVHTFYIYIYLIIIERDKC